MTRNPAKLAGKNPQPASRGVRVYTVAELETIGAELGTVPAAAVASQPLPDCGQRSGRRSRRDGDKGRLVLHEASWGCV